MLSLVQILFLFVLNSLSYTIQCPKTKGNKILTKDKIEPQHNYTSIYKSAADYNFSTIHWMNHHMHSVDNEPIVFNPLMDSTMHLFSMAEYFKYREH